MNKTDIHLLNAGTPGTPLVRERSAAHAPDPILIPDVSRDTEAGVRDVIDRWRETVRRYESDDHHTTYLVVQWLLQDLEQELDR